MRIIDLLLGQLDRQSNVKGQKQDCPICKTQLTLDMEKCPKCGSRLADIFTLICPGCKANIPLRESRCGKCGFDLAAPPKQRFVCPRCQYSADYWMLQCPACGVKFSS